MGYYKIQNVTNKLPKRHINKDVSVDIEYNVGFKKNIYKLNAGGIIGIACSNIPIKLHTLRAKKLITIIEIGEKEFQNLKNPKPVKTIKIETKKEKSVQPKKRIIKKKKVHDEIVKEGEI